MSHAALKASFSLLPTELLGFIIPDPVVLHPALSSLDASTFEWMHIKLDSSQVQMSAPERETLMTLRALSQTSQRLRSLALPLLWSVLNIARVNQLGKLHEIFREQPHLAAHVKHSTFSWWSEEGLNDTEAVKPPDEEHGSVLDMAFVDRGALWDRKRAECGSTVYVSRAARVSYFSHRAYLYVQPGTFSKRNKASINPDRSGPDGVGQDPRIKSPKDFNQALDEIVPRFSCLTSFNWQCEATPMPLRVFQALQKAQPLTRLHTALWFPKQFKHLPIWRLACQLEYLSIGTLSREHLSDGDYNYRHNLRFVTAMEFDEVELPSAPREGNEDILAASALLAVLNAVTGGRTSDRGGRLTRLLLPGTSRTLLWKVFAVPTLMPAWVRIDDWGMDEEEFREWQKYRDPRGEEAEEESTHYARDWLLAAVMLRRAHFHCSRASLAQQPGSTSSRLLTSNDVKAMGSEFRRNGLPLLSNPTGRLASLAVPDLSLVRDSPIDRYFDWLIEEDGLAQQVADAWNTVVERGDADLLTCYCATCYMLVAPT